MKTTVNFIKKLENELIKLLYDLQRQYHKDQAGMEWYSMSVLFI